jgi:hypothetical protein
MKCRTKLKCLLDLAEKACEGQTLKLIMNIRKLWAKKFYIIGPRYCIVVPNL